jgi:hypothetical protein
MSCAKRPRDGPSETAIGARDEDDLTHERILDKKDGDVHDGNARRRGIALICVRRSHSGLGPGMGRRVYMKGLGRVRLVG